MSGYLCENLMFEIFTRLRSKSLIRFRSLSKSLCSCIASPHFIRMHTLRSSEKILIKHHSYSPIRELYTLHTEDQLPTCHKRYNGIPIESPSNNVSICIGSCNGIISELDFDKRIISLWNPSIGRKLTLPKGRVRCSSLCPQSCSCGAGRIWTASNWNPNGIGFGFDPIIDDHKIVSLPKCGGTGESSYVYIVKTGSWSAVTSPTPPFINVTSRGCFVNGVLHWVAQRRLPESNDVISHYILTFDLSTHAFGMIALPKPSWDTRILTIIQGSLAVISSKDYTYSCVWVMRDYDNTISWSEFFNTRRNLQSEAYLNRVLQSTSNSDLLFYNIDNKWFQYGASRLWDLDAHIRIVDLETYVESLQLLDMCYALPTITS